MTTQTQLDTQLNELKVNAENINLLTDTALGQERLFIAQCYIWWREARQINGYLQGLYKQHHIVGHSVKNGENFRPFLRLIHNNRIEKTNLDNWSKAVRKIHDEVEDKPEHYKNDTVERIAHFIRLNGGKTGLAGYGKNKNDHLDIDDDQQLADDQYADLSLFQLSEQELIAVLRDEARGFYGSSPLQGIELPALHVTDQGYSLIVVKKNGQATELVGTTNNGNLIDAALVGTYRNDFRALSTTVRCVLEPLHLLNEPQALANFYDKLRELGDITDTQHGKGRKEKSHRRLIYRPATQDFLLSYMGVSASPVVISKPKHSLLDRESGDLFLPNTTRRSVEARLLHQAAFNLFKTTAPEKFKTVSPGFIASHYVDLHTKIPIADHGGITAAMIRNVVTNINHSSLSLIPFYKSWGTPRWQVDFKRDKFQPSWQAELSLDWLRSFSTDFLDKWIFAYGSKANREVNKTLYLSMRQRDISIAYEYSTTGGYETQTEFPSHHKGAVGQVQLTVRSADFVFALKQLASLDVLDSIRVEANASAVGLMFETAVSSYQCWIPASDLKGKRNKDCFAVYDPTYSSDFEMLFDLDDMVPEPTAQEDAQLREKLSRLKR